ncbi:MAG TPA: YeeE/YedE family protein [Polyangiaceae bacterium]
MNIQVINVAQSLAGGASIGLGASLLYWSIGRVAGISGILAGVIRPQRNEWGWRVAFLLGLLVAGTALSGVAATRQLEWRQPNWLVLAVAGICVGFGARLGGGCTSGHGVCGISRLRVRSVTATALFMATGAVTVFFARHLAGAL